MKGSAALSATLLFAVASVGSARADTPLFFPGDDVRRAAEERELATRLAQQVLALPGVVRADVLVDLPRPAEVALDAPLPATGVSIALSVGSPPGPSPEALARVIAAAGLGADTAVSIARRELPTGLAIAVGDATKPPPDAARHLTRDRVGLLASLVANVFLATALLWRMPHRIRRRATRSKVS